MSRQIALGLLLALAACGRSGVADVTLDADATQRNATSTKMIGDLAAADAASRGPAPEVHDREPIIPAPRAIGGSVQASRPAPAPIASEEANVASEVTAVE